MKKFPITRAMSHVTCHRSQVFIFLLLLLIVLLPNSALALKLLPDCGSDSEVEQIYADPETGEVRSRFSPPCGLNDFVQLIQNAIAWLMIIAFPIAALMIGWGGAQIMISAGSPEKIKAGKEKIRIAIIGIIILLLSWLIVRAIFLALGVTSQFTPGGLDTGSSDL